MKKLTYIFCILFFSFLTINAIAQCEFKFPPNAGVCGVSCNNCDPPRECSSQCSDSTAIVTVYQCTNTFPQDVCKCFACERYVNAALATGYVLTEKPLLIESSSPDPIDYSCNNCEIQNIGLIRVPINSGTLSRAHVAHYPYDHYAYRAKQGEENLYYSKHGNGSDDHIYKHWDDLTCLGFNLVDSLWVFVGNEICVQPSNAFSSANGTIYIQNGQSISLELFNHEDVAYQWTETSPYLSIIGCTTCNKVSLKAALCVPNAQIGTVTVKYKAADENCAGCYQRKQTYNVVAVSNSCCIIGTYSYSFDNNLYTYDLSTWNNTSAYATSVTITDCVNSTLTWTKISGSGSIYVTNNGKNATIYLNSNQSASYLIQGGGNSRTVTFTRTNFSPNDPGDGKELSILSSGIVKSEFEQDFQSKSPIIGYPKIINEVKGEKIENIVGSNPEVLGLEDEYEGAIRFNPNPANEILSIEVPVKNSGQKFQLFDLSGGLIFSQIVESSQLEVDISSLPEGLYILKIGGWSAKFVKIGN